MKWMETTHTRLKGSKLLNLPDAPSGHGKASGRASEASRPEAAEGTASKARDAAVAGVHGQEGRPPASGKMSGRPAEGERRALIPIQLARLKEVDGFCGAGVFSPAGELAEACEGSMANLEEVGAIANEILLKSQKASENMGLGRSELVHIQAERSQVLVRCVDEAAHQQASAGKAHFHILLVLAPTGNLALAKIKLSSVAEEMAALLR